MSVALDFFHIRKSVHYSKDLWDRNQKENHVLFPLLCFWVAFNLVVPLCSFILTYPHKLVWGFVESNNHKQILIGQDGFPQRRWSLSMPRLPRFPSPQFPVTSGSRFFRNVAERVRSRMCKTRSNYLVILWSLLLHSFNIFLGIKESSVDLGHLRVLSHVGSTS